MSAPENKAVILNWGFRVPPERRDLNLTDGVASPRVRPDLTMLYICRGEVLGVLESSCFADEKILIKPGCSINVTAPESMPVRYYASTAAIHYAPDAATMWEDCNETEHLQRREPLCIVDGKFYSVGYCEAAGLTPPLVERPCCSQYEDMYDTVFNTNYNRVTVFFDTISLACLVSTSIRVSELICICRSDHHIVSCECRTTFISSSCIFCRSCASGAWSWRCGAWISSGGRRGGWPSRGCSPSRPRPSSTCGR
jgi:hypothetical protein